MRKRVIPFPHPSSLIRHPSGERGVALILTLGILVLVTMLVIAFAVSMRVENTASKNFNDYYKARELAKGAIDQAVAQIRQATPLRVGNAIAGIYTNYVTFPGGAYYYDGATVTFKPLYSCPSCPNPLPANTTNLNAGFWITGQNPPLPPGEFVVESDSAIDVEWTYVYTNGIVGQASLGGNGPLVGRFAFWVDDEASKININTGWKRPNPSVTADAYGYGAPSEVDLNMLLAGLNIPDAIQGRQPSPGYTTIEEVKIADASPTPYTPNSDFNTNRFYLTTYSNDANYPGYTDDRDVFDRPRMVISSLTNDPNAFIVGANDAYDRLADSALARIVSPIGGPLVGTFAVKYPVVNFGGNSVDGLKQIIANIGGYQADLVNTWPPDDVANTPPTYLGLAKTPLINEVQVRYDVTPGTGTPPAPSTVKRTISVELYYMYNGRYTTGLVPGTEQLVISGLPPLGSPPLFSPNVTISLPANRTFIAGTPSVYQVFSPTLADTTTFTGNPITEGTTPQIAYRHPGHRLNFAQTTLQRNQIFSSGGASVYQGSQVIGDPAFNGVNTTTEWAPYTSASGATLGGANAGASVPSDTSKVVMRGGLMQSIGELGFIHLPPDAALTNAWMHLKLQPGGGASAGQIPDWAMLDLFTAGGGTAGRVNINSGVIPGFPNARRLVPLKALLNNIGTLPVAAAAQQIYVDDSLTARTDTYGMREVSVGDTLGIFDTIGEICEIPSLLNSGANDFAREAVIRRIANLITVRSSTFTIWVMAQSIKQVPNTPAIGTFTPGTDLITGEVRAQAVVERYEDASTTPAKVKFRVRYFRYL